MPNWSQKLGCSISPRKRSRLWRAVVAEYVATTLFVFCACASVVLQSVNGNVPTIATNLLAGIVQGFAIGSLVYAVAFTSGGHINPAVTAALVVTGDMPLLHAAGYIVAQLCGGMTGAGLLKAVMPHDVEGNLGTTQLGNGISHFQGFLFEAIVTFILIFVIFGTVADVDDVSDSVKPLAPLPIGFSVAVGVTIAYGFTGGSLNPARSFGPAVVSHTWHNQYIYWAGPLAGSLIAAMFYRTILRTKPIAHAAPEDTTKHDDIETGNIKKNNLEKSTEDSQAISIPPVLGSGAV